MKKTQLTQIVKEIATEALSNKSNVHPWVLNIMADLRDDLNFYLDNKDDIDLSLLRQKLNELLKVIKEHGYKNR